MKKLYDKFKVISKEIRVWQWVKNFLVFIPLIFSSKLFDPAMLSKTIYAFIALCLSSSFVYVVNDIFDVESDRNHPKKKERPIAKGLISIGEAFVLAISLLLVSLFFAYISQPIIIILICFFVLANLYYSKVLKHIPILDILVVSIFYIYRVYVGAVVINVPISGWLLLTTFFISLFMITGKRRAELVTSNGGTYSRRVLNEYNEKFLDFALLMSLTLLVTFYSLYSIFVHDRLFAISIIFVVYCSLRYLYLIFSKNEGEEPEKIIFSDKWMLAGGMIFGIYVVLVLYFNLSQYIRL